MRFEDSYELEAMHYFDRSDDSKLSPQLLTKKYNMIKNHNNEYIASQKWDGNWMMFIKGGPDDEIVVRGRNRNTKDVYENYAPKIPHLVQEFDERWPNYTVILAEVCWPELGKVATDVGTILRCLAPKAIKRQENHKLVAKVFDILYFDNEEIADKTYETRVAKIHELECFSTYIRPTWFFATQFAETADDIISRGGEGIVIQRRDNLYEPGKRTAWHTLKLKQRFPEIELKVTGTLDPEKYYYGIEEDTWKYWEYTDTITGHTTLLDNYPCKDDYFGQDYIQLKALTRPYYFGWKVGVVVDYNGNPVKVSSGTCDADREWLASEEAAAAIAQGKLYAVIKGMQQTNNADGTKSIRHPVLVRLRLDVQED